MTNAQKYFIVVAEELNISKSAKKLFISQQCLSIHIKKLEISYGMPLFERKPHLRLTPAGDMLYNTLRQIQVLENNLRDGIREIDAGSSSVFRIGLHSWRAQAILPNILPAFQAQFPNLKMKIYSNVTVELEQGLLSSKFDLVIARARAMDERIHTIKLLDEPLYLAISDTLLRQYFPNRYPGCKQEFKRGISIKEFERVPFVLGLESSNSYADVMEYFSVNGVTPRCFFQTNISEMHTGITGICYGAGFCPMTMLPLLLQKQGNEFINIFPLKDYTIRNSMQVAYLRNSYLSQYTRRFIALVQEYFRGFEGATLESFFPGYYNDTEKN